MSNTHCLAPQVATLALQALKASHAHPRTFKVVNLVLPFHGQHNCKYLAQLVKWVSIVEK